MTNLIIIEGNMPESVAKGRAGALGFERTFAMLDPGVTSHVLAPHVAKVTADDLRDADGIIFTGSGEAFGVDSPDAAPQRAAMELALGTGKPVWGSCNGMQLGAVVLGARTGPSPNGIELGIARDMVLTDAGRAHPMMTGRTDRFAVPCIHRDEVRDLPSGITLIAGNAHTPIQTIACSTGGVDLWAAQYHAELDTTQIADFIRADGMYAGFGSFISDLDSAETDAAAAERLGTVPAALRTGTRSLELRNWLTHVQTRAARLGQLAR